MNKDLYFQELRGLAIIAVVFIHVISSSMIFDTNNLFSLVFRQFFNFAVPLFFFISGYFVNKEQIINGNLKKYYRNKLPRILYPYLFWSFLLLAKDNFYNFDISRIIINLLTGQVLGIYYYIIVLIQFIIITPLLVKLISNKRESVNKALWFATPFSLVMLYIINFNVFEILFPWNALWFPLWFVFYFYGLTIKDIKQTSNISIISIIYILSIVISIAEALFLNNKFKYFQLSQVKISSFLMSFLLINLLISLKPIKKNNINFLVSLGNYSFGIYLIHMFILPFVNQLMPKFSLFYYNQFATYVITVVITLGLCVIVIKISKRVFGENISKKIFGF